MGVIYFDFNKAFNAVSVEHYALDEQKTRQIKKNGLMVGTRECWLIGHVLLEGL